jgi:hypothetical protein
MEGVRKENEVIVLESVVEDRWERGGLWLFCDVLGMEVGEFWLVSFGSILVGV